MATSSTRANFDYPTGTPVVDAATLEMTVPWANWTQRIQNIVRTLNTSGPTAQRPTSNLYIGLFFFDTTINKPIWLRSVNPNVWVDGAGTIS